MNKLETLTELLVNELTSFGEDVQKLKKELDRAEHLKVKFDVAPIEHFIKHLDSFQTRETQNRVAYESRLGKKIENAKIYPKWAVITFIAANVISFGAIFFGYQKHIAAEEMENIAYENGKTAATEYINLYLSENPKALEQYKKWSESK